MRRPLDLKGGLFALLLSTLWAGNPIATKTGLEYAPPLRFGWIRFGLGLIVVFIWAAISRQSLKPERHEWRSMLTLGVLFAIQLAFLNYGQKYTTASHVVVINTTMPLWVGILAHFMIPGDRLDRTRFLGTLVAYGGVVTLFWKSLGGGSGTLLGDGLSLISAILLAERQIYIAKSSSRVNLPKLLAAQGLIGMALFIGFSFAIERDPWVWSGEFALAMFYTGMVIAGFGFIGSSWLLSRYFPSRVSVISLSQPLIGVVLAWWLLGERMGPELWAGAGLVVIGSFLAQRRGAEKPA
jgi:drug/metabolite transporter (DMT)-like permease